ncbi:MFS transporter [Vibrio cholerae]|nr:MFS transporter [Vibrio cholerae]
MFSLFLSELLLNVVKAVFLIGAATNILQLSDSILLFGFTILFEVISSVLAPMSIGKIIDRKGSGYVYNRLFLLMTLLSLVLLVIHAYLDFIIYIFVAYSIISFFSPLQRLAQQAYFSDARGTHDLKEINAKHQISVQLGQIFGLVLASILVDKSSFQLLHSVALGVLIMGTLLSMRLSNHSVSSPNEQQATLLNIVKTVPKLPMIIVLVSTFDYVVISIFNLSLPVLSQDYDEQGKIMSYFDMSYAVGSIAISYLVTRGALAKGDFKMSSIAYAIIPLIFIGLVTYTTFELRMFIIFVIGAMLTLSTIGFNSYIQSTIPKEIIGRILALRRIVLAIFLFITINSLSIIQSLGDTEYYFSLVFIVVLLSVIIILTTIYGVKSVKVHSVSRREA